MMSNDLFSLYLRSIESLSFKSDVATESETLKPKWFQDLMYRTCDGILVLTRVQRLSVLIS